MPEVKIQVPRPHDKQREILDSDAKRKVIRAGRRSGKAQPLDSIVYTPSGPRKMGDIKVGMQVLTPGGGKSRVVAVYPQGMQDIYRVKFNDHTYARCTHDHLWQVDERRVDSKWQERSRILTTEYISGMKTVTQKGRGTSRRPFLPRTQRASFDQKDVPLNPYLLGVLIGDGTMTQEKGTHDYRLTKGKYGHKNPIIQALKKLELWGKYSFEKFIPDIYKYNSIDIRLEVLRGLFDSDGWVDRCGQPRIDQTSKRLSEDIAEVIQSIGGLAYTSTKKAGYKTEAGQYKQCKDVYCQSILYDEAQELFSLPSKLAKIKKRAHKVKRYIHGVEYDGKALAQCIQIDDPNGLYLTDNFIATHNTVCVSIGAIQWFLAGKRVLYAAPTMEQVGRFWATVTRALDPLVKKKCLGRISQSII